MFIFRLQFWSVEMDVAPDIFHYNCSSSAESQGDFFQLMFFL